jgi:hypothetical protein
MRLRRRRSARPRPLPRRRRRRVPALALRRRHAAHARDQLARRERLGDVVVGAELEADDAVDLVAARGQEDDRHLARLANPLEDLEAARIGQADVEDDQRRGRLADPLQRFLAGRAPGRLEAVGAQRVLQRVGDAGLVLDDEDPGLHRRQASARTDKRETFIPEGNLRSRGSARRCRS